mgnify:CR=1 FL=1
MAVTIKDVAALAGVSPSTVSRTCKNNPSISEETKERVRKAMAELGYEPNFQQAILPLRIRVPLASFSPLPQKKSMRTPSIWKQSRESAIIVMADSI